MSTTRRRRVVAGETMFPPRAPFFEIVGNLEVPHTPPRS